MWVCFIIKRNYKLIKGAENIMKKRFLSLVLVLCVMITSLMTFSGCSLLHDNDKRYYAEVVAKVGDSTITRNEVLTMFNYYYYTQGYYQYGYSEDVVFDMVMEALVKNKIMAQEAKKLDECKLTDEDEYYIWEQVFANIDSEIDEYEDEIRTLFGVEDREVEEEEEDTTDLIFKEYERSSSSGTIAEAEVKRTKEEWVDYLNKSTNKTTNYYRFLAYSKYISNLEKSAEKYEKKAKSTAELLDEEFVRLYDYYKESRYVAKYTAYIANKITISDDEISEEYRKALNSQIQSFAISDGYSSTITDTSNTDLVIYRQTGGYFTVQHILLQFADYDSELSASEYLYNLDNYVSSYDSNEDLEQTFIDEFLAEREDYAMNNEESLNMDYINPNTGKTNLDDNGNEVNYTREDFDKLVFGSVANGDEADGIYTRYQNNEITYEELAKEFFKLKFSFSKDSGVTDLTNLTNLMGYVLPTSEAEGNSFVSEFADTSYDLYEQYLTDGTYGIKTVVTNFGIHYIMFTGVINSGTLSLDDEFTLVSDETVEDYFYESILSTKKSTISADVSSVLYNQYFNDGKIEMYCETYDECL